MTEKTQDSADEVRAGKESMKIICLAGGPARLYFSILAKKANPSWDIAVIERNQSDSTLRVGRRLFR